ncbi:ABC transporter ATP-binding protein [Pseudoxanthomonas kalamensis DSM 18571]|uniref:ABC transporter ATP-binding protein n=1 Tax=Pseudoxanthomonas kalamensis TaxID=289483 RepID=UPI001390C8F1|nr:ATP-binding cassette domain-containing protein [Pseudoxanthomonas kalamensis]KAF1712438.1 ABC transporter ATP-binding protein [Pseudoxanthomonas kalamensis DSM 18571]
MSSPCSTNLDNTTDAASDASTGPTLIELDRARVIRGNAVVLHDLSLSIAQGQHTAILGPNGCGKSTFIKLIDRELFPVAREGETPIRLFGMPRWNTWELRKQLGVVANDLGRDLQEMHELQVEEAVLSGCFASWVVPPDAEVDENMRRNAAWALERMQAGALAARRCAELSTGEMRRVLIARALVNRPQALLLDEPTAGLDPVAQQQFLQLLRTLAAQGITLVMVTHHIEEIVPEIDRVVLLRAGQVLADGSREQVLTAERLSAAFGGPMQVRREGERYFASHLG